LKEERTTINEIAEDVTHEIGKALTLVIVTLALRKVRPLVRAGLRKAKLLGTNYGKH